jgi:hypothetical protein
MIMPNRFQTMVLPTTVRDSGEALRYAVEDLHTPKTFGAHLEVGDERFNSIEIGRLYEALRKPSDRARRTPHSGNETDRASLEWKILAND